MKLTPFDATAFTLALVCIAIGSLISNQAGYSKPKVERAGLFLLYIGAVAFLVELVVSIWRVVEF